MCTELAWVRAARAGDHEAFARLVDRFQRPIFSLAYRMLGNVADAEDAAQESFLKAYRALGAYDERRSFSTWILSVAAHHCIDRLRRRRLIEVPFESLAHLRIAQAPAPDPVRLIEASETADRINRLMARLPADYRLVLALRYWHDLGYEEIAAVIGDSESAVKSRLHRARRQLADALSADDARGAAVSQDGSTGARTGAPNRRVSPCAAKTLANS